MCCIIETCGNVHRRPLCVQNKRYGFTAHTEYSTVSQFVVARFLAAFNVMAETSSHHF
jgi:hypothetical protein